ncbi:MAG TPA: hypothetical protein VF624_07695 [Tepidisphaeraceae bacterium]|jgi:hypothetical protein
MMRRRNVTAAVAAALCVSTAAALAADLPAAARQAAPVPPAMAATITQYVNAQIDVVLGPDAKAAGIARDELARQTETSPAVTPSADFRAAYVSAIEANLPKLLKSSRVGHRLAGAIVVTRVAKATSLSSLEDEIILLMNDSSPAVALWGVKGARAVVPGVLSLKARLGNQKLTENVVTAVTRHPGTGALVQEAYAALDVSAAQPPVPPAGLVVGTQATLALLEARIGEYVKGMPSAPMADRDPPLYFGKTPVNSAIDAKEKVRVVQALCNLMSVSAERLIDRGGTERQELMLVAQGAAGALIVQMQIAGSTPANEAQATAAIAALKPVRDLDRQLPAQIKAVVDGAVAAIKAVPQFTALKNAPAVQPLAVAAPAGAVLPAGG